MDKERINGAGQKAKGVIEEAAGKLTGDAKLKAQGQADKAAGTIRNAVGGAADAMRQASKP